MNNNLQTRKENHGESKVLRSVIIINTVIGALSAPVWLVILVLIMACDGGCSSNDTKEQVIGFIFYGYPVVMILTIFIVKKLKSVGQIKFAMWTSFLYWWLCSFFFM